MDAPLTILIIDDEAVIRRTLGDYLRDCDNRTLEADNGEDGLKTLENHAVDIILVDVLMPGMDGFTVLAQVRERHPDIPVIIITGHGDMAMAIRAIRAGAADFLTKPIRLIELDAVIEKTRRSRVLQKENVTLKNTVERLLDTESESGLLGKSPGMENVRTLIAGAITAECETVLIIGETGTGKEVVARELHRLSERSEKPFFAISCPTIPDTLIEAELFGVTRGAYTGATQDRPGYFELADRGTLFLDEIADLSPRAQASMLRVLETRSVRRVGSPVERPVDVRVIAATNAPMDTLIASGKFRADLYYRLNLFTIALPPLRERPEDIELLAEHFLRAYALKKGKTPFALSESVRKKLRAYGYPGNVRELRHIVERAAMLGGAAIQPEHILLPETRETPDEVQTGNGERAYLTRALENARWNRRQAARDLGISYATLRYKLDRLGIK